jgi:hypothetical protein
MNVPIAKRDKIFQLPAGISDAVACKQDGALIKRLDLLF